MSKITEHEMLVTLATMALKMNDLTGHDIIEALQGLGHGNVVAEARDPGPNQHQWDGRHCCILCGVDQNGFEPFAIPICDERARLAFEKHKEECGTSQNQHVWFRDGCYVLCGIYKNGFEPSAIPECSEQARRTYEGHKA